MWSELESNRNLTFYFNSLKLRKLLRLVWMHLKFTEYFSSSTFSHSTLENTNTCTYSDSRKHCCSEWYLLITRRAKNWKSLSASISHLHHCYVRPSSEEESHLGVLFAIQGYLVKLEKWAYVNEPSTRLSARSCTCVRQSPGSKHVG